MSNVRIPRKKKKIRVFFHPYTFPQVNRLYKFYAYLNIERDMKRYNLTAEGLYLKFSRYTMDDVIWWNWIRYKMLGIEPQMSVPFKKYWDYFVSEGVIKF